MMICIGLLFFLVLHMCCLPACEGRNLYYVLLTIFLLNYFASLTSQRHYIIEFKKISAKACAPRLLAELNRE
jgi:hypothetical protein